jgi:rRNA maturation endonuclease Nob1
MARIDLVCKDCKHDFTITTRTALKPKQKCCPACGSKNIRQTLASYSRNGPLSSPQCGAPQNCSSYG